MFRTSFFTVYEDSSTSLEIFLGGTTYIFRSMFDRRVCYFDIKYGEGKATIEIK